METSWREQPRAENRCGYEIDKRDAAPHQRGGALLICYDRKSKMPRHGKVHRVRNAVGEDKKSGEDVTRQRGKKQV